MLKRWLGNVLGGFRPAGAGESALLEDAARLLAAGQVKEARIRAEAALSALPRNARALHLCGVLRCADGEFEGGLACLREAIARDAANLELRLDFANALHVGGDYEGAELEYRNAIPLAGRMPRPHIALGTLLLQRDRPKEALTVFEEAARIDRQDREVCRGLALAAYRCHDYARAAELYRYVGQGGTKTVDERNCHGVALQYAGELGQAAAVLEALLAELSPDAVARPIVARNLAYCYLTAGRWREGFGLHESRQDAIRLAPPVPESLEWLDFIDKAIAGIPPWDGTDISGKRMLIWSEQGQGDVIMLVRLLSALRTERQAASIVLLGPSSQAYLASLSQHLDFVSAYPEWRPDPEAFDVQCSIMSLPYLMQIAPDNIPGKVPYFVVPENRRATWRPRIASLNGIKVGLAWAGNPKLALDCLRSVALGQLEPVLENSGVAFVSLQKDEAARDELRHGRRHISDWMDACHDFADTAALIEGLDLVISVDTAVAHMAGALGKPVWLLNRFESEWRWLRGREDSVWYPTMKIFNQTSPRDWRPIMGRVADELRSLVARHGGKPGC